MARGGAIDPDNAALELAAIAADYYHMPLFAYIEHLRQVRERYGNQAAVLDLNTAVYIKQEKNILAEEIEERRARKSGSI